MRRGLVWVVVLAIGSLLDFACCIRSLFGAWALGRMLCFFFFFFFFFSKQKRSLWEASFSCMPF